MNYKELKEKLSKVDLISAYPFINNYGISTKTNKETGNDELVVEFGVSSKIKFDEINSNYMLPKSLSAYGIDIKTKVTQINQASINFTNDADEAIKYYEKVGKNLELSDEYMQLQKDYEHYKTFITAQNNSLSVDINYSFNPLDANVMPIKRNRQLARPLSGGCSSIYSGGSDATLGLIVRDKQDKKIVALSNSHVYSRSLLLGEEASINGQLNNMLGLSGRQPGSNEFNPYGNTDPVVDHIGTPKRTSRISYTGDDNKVDACILELSSYNLLDASSKNVIWFKQKGPYEFATTDEIDSIMDPSSVNYQSPVFRSGRTLGPLGYPGNIIENSKTTLSQSVTSIISLNERLTANDGFQAITHGVSSLYYNFSSFFGRPSEGMFMFTTADETSAFIVGSKHYYGQSSRNPLFFTSFDDYSTELAIIDPDGIQDISIFQAFFGGAYVSKTGKIYYSGNRPGWTAAMYNHREFGGVYDYKNTSSTNFAQVLDSSNGSVFSKPIKKSHLQGDGAYVLTEDNELYTMGANMILSGDETKSKSDVWLCGLPYSFNNASAMSNSVSGMTKIPGDWIDFTATSNINETQLYALSSSGHLFTAYCTTGRNSSSLGSQTLHNGFMGDTPPEFVMTTEKYTLSASFDLKRTQIPITLGGNNIRFKKIFTGGDQGIYPASRMPLMLQTQDNRILVIQKSNQHSSPGIDYGYLKYQNQDFIAGDERTYIQRNSTIDSSMQLVSGVNVYGIGDFFSNHTASDWVETIGNGLSYDIQNLLPFTNFYDIKKWNNFPPNNCINVGGAVGYHPGTSNANSARFRGTAGYTNVYTDGIGLSGIGYAPSGIFNTFGQPLPDEIILRSVNRAINVGGFTDSGAVSFTENLDMISKNENCAVTAGGDSGTAIFACLSSTVPTLSTFKLIGLVYAGPAPQYNSPGYGVRIDNIQNELDIEPWDGII